MPEDARPDPIAALRLAPVDGARPVADQIHAALKAAILRADLPPGCLLSETEVGARFGASRTPVRDAFTRLRDDGLIVTWPSRGSYVAPISEPAILQAQFLREALELACVTRACETGLREPNRLVLDATLAAQAEAAQRGDMERFQMLDDVFHTEIAKATGFERAEILLMREKSALDRLRVLALSDRAHIAMLLDQHRAIYHALLARDAAAARTAMRTHLRAVLDTLAMIKTRHADLFDDAQSN
jgi:DNA-binding GntR family transcriptional regulator